MGAQKQLQNLFKARIHWELRSQKKSSKGWPVYVNLSRAAALTLATHYSLFSAMQKYQTTRSLASALYGDVILAKEVVTGDAVAIKRVELKCAEVSKSKKTQQNIDENAFLERKVNRMLSKHGGHKNVLHMRDDFEQKGTMHMVFEYCAKGELFDLVTPQEGMPDQKAQKYFSQIAQGTRFIHRKGFAHRDLSLENVLIDRHDVAKICDFGLCARAGQRRSERVGKLLYMAPEVCQAIPYDPVQADMWSLGVILFILLTGIPPVEHASENDERYRVIAKYGVQTLLKSWKFDETMDPLAFDLLGRLLCIDPSERMTMEQLIHHPWIVATMPHKKNSSQYVYSSLAQALNKVKTMCPKRQFLQAKVKQFF